MESKLLDLRDCSDGRFREIHRDMLHLHLLRQPAWFRPFLLRSAFLRYRSGHDHWSRAWEYPWAIEAADLDQTSLRTLDVGGGGSPFADYLAQQGHDSYVVDPSLNRGVSFSDSSRDKCICEYLRYHVLRSLLNFLGINRLWGIPVRKRNTAVHYYPYSATAIEFPDNYFDRVFCLSVMEHIPIESWQRCIKEFERVLKAAGRLIITLDMETVQANNRQYLRLVDYCSLELVGDPYYEVPITSEDQQLRHPGYTSYETIGMVWQAKK